MTKPIARDSIYRRRVFDAEVIELCVRWYITYRLSYRAMLLRTVNDRYAAAIPKVSRTAFGPAAVSPL